MNEAWKIRGALAALAAAASLFAGCSGGRSTGDIASGPGSSCALFDEPATRSTRPVRIALAERVDPLHAPIPVNDSERLLFRTLYETLVRVDCEGNLLPGLAESWAGSDGGRAWSFILRKGVRFADGSALGADDVVLAWLGARTRLGADRLDLTTPWYRIETDSIRAVNERTVRIGLAEAADLPRLLAHVAFSVTRWRGGEDDLPHGTAQWIVEPGSRLHHGKLVCVRNGKGGAGGNGPERLVFELADRDVDRRNLLGGQVDALYVRNREIIDYAADLPGYSDLPLPWDRNYLVLVPPDTLAPGGRPAPIDFEAERETIARYVAVSDARPSRSFRFREELPAIGRCPGISAGAAWTYVQAAVRNDPDAVEIAERFVALDPFLFGARSTAEIVHIARPGAVDPCTEWRALLSRLLRLSYQFEPDDEHPPEDLIESGAVVPLIETRAHLITRAGLTGITINGDGTPVLDRIGWAEGALP